MSDRVMIPFGHQLLVLSREAFKSALREGAGIVEEHVLANNDLVTEARPLLKAEDAAALLGVDASWLLRESRLGRLPYHKLGKYVRFDPREIAQHSARPAVSTESNPKAARTEFDTRIANPQLARK